MKKYYIVKYYGGSYDDFYKTVLFITDKKSTAIKYTRKFNRILKKWKEYYKQFENTEHGFKWLAEEHMKHFDRWNYLKNITKCYYEEVKFRN